MIATLNSTAVVKDILGTTVKIGPTVWLLQYSPSQQCLHIGSNEDCVRDLLDLVLRRHNPDYITLFASTSRDDIQKFGSVVQKWVDANR